MQHKINKLNEDYRQELSTKFLDISAKMRELVANLETRTLSFSDSGDMRP
jgi:hypothetical protein